MTLKVYNLEKALCNFMVPVAFATIVIHSAITTKTLSEVVVTFQPVASSNLIKTTFTFTHTHIIRVSSQPQHAYC